MNRLSAVSSESGKNSSESVEVISGSTCGTGCTTTPDTSSEPFSQSASASMGSKKDSDSVEVLPDSLTSPSSIEILPDSLNSQQQFQTSNNRWSQLTENELPSPFEQSPPTTDNDTMTFFSARSTKQVDTPDSIEVIPTEDRNLEEEEADDTISYTSLSETSTAATTVLEPKRPKLLKDMMTESITSDLSLSPDRAYPGSEPPITKGPSRSGLHLPLAPIATQPHVSMQHYAGPAFTALMEPTNVIDIPAGAAASSDSSFAADESGSQSDRTLTAGDVMESSSDTSTTTESNSNSFYLKNMLADAMTDENADRKWHLGGKRCGGTAAAAGRPMAGVAESEPTPGCPSVGREAAHSPISSESRSDLVKIGSEQTSEHTSGDELETTASSDIEIISSPNGDSSSTQSRQSPAKLAPNAKGEQAFPKKSKGHNREPSEASSQSDEGVQRDQREEESRQHLLRRLAEMTEILEVRETKLIETSRRNAELTEQNAELRRKLDLLSKQVEAADLTQLVTQEDYTQRLSVLEKKFQQAMREKESLKRQLTDAKAEAAGRMSKAELETLVREKDETIAELREEGEKLSKQQLQHSNIIKKLRSKEKEHDACIAHLKSRVEELSSETERLKRSLAAKEEVERSQIEAINQLTARNRKLEQQSAGLQSQLDDAVEKLDTTKTGMEAAKRELQDHARTHAELLARERALSCLEDEKRLTDSQNEEVINQLEDLRLKVRLGEQEALRKEQTLRAENADLLRRLEEAEMRKEELTQSVSQATKPLVRQLEALQATYSMKSGAWEKSEQALLLKLAEVQSRVSALAEGERASREECVSLRAKVGSVETQLNASVNQVELLKTQLDQLKAERALVEAELKRESEGLQRRLNGESAALEAARKSCVGLEQQISVEKAATEAEKRRNVLLQEQLRERQKESAAAAGSGTTSPTLSLGRLSLSESLGSANWQTDDGLLDLTAAMPTSASMFEVQSLHSNLKQRDGEVQQLQWELKRREQERTFLNAEISSLINKLEDAEQRVVDYAELGCRLEDLQQKYDALCQMYGEKVEETEELRLDLQDVKEMYKTQIDELLKKKALN